MWRCCETEWSNQDMHCRICGYFRIAGGEDTWQCTGCWNWNTPDRERYCRYCGKLRTATPIQTYFLARLRWMLKRQCKYANRDYPNPYAVQMFAKAIFSTRRDLEALGLGDEARRVVERQGGTG